MNAIFSDMVVDATVGNTIVLSAKNTPRNGTRPIAVYHHGFTQDGWVPVSGPLYGQMAQIHNLVNMGYIVATSDYGLSGGAAAQLWGNSTDQARMADVLEYTAAWAGYPAQSNAVVGGTTFRGGYLNTGKKFTFMGASMGCLASLNFVGTYPAYAAAVIGFIGVVDLNDIYYQTSPIAYGPYIDAAYPPSYNDTTMGNTYNPTKEALLGKYSNIPIYLVSGSTDATASTATHTQFKTNVISGSGSAANVTTNVVTGSGHDEDTLNNHPKSMVLDWLAKYSPIT